MPTEEQKKRIDDFLKEYGELVQKHKVDFVNFPMFTPTQSGTWEIRVNTQPVDTSEQPVKSFIQP